MLKRGGHKVTTSMPSQRFTLQPADLVILCHTLAESERHNIILAATAQYPATDVLCLTSAFELSNGFVHSFDSFDGPAKLLKKVQTLLECRAT